MTYKPGSSYQLFPRDEAASGISGYKRMQPPPFSLAEATVSAAVKAADGEVLLKAWISDALGTTSLTAGTWAFSIYAALSSGAGDTTLKARVYRRTSAGTETELFNVTSAAFDDISAALVAFSSSQSAHTVDVTDRLVLKLYCQTTNATDITVTVYYLGAANQSRIDLPFLVPVISGGDMTAALYDPDGDGQVAGGSTGGGHIIQEEGASLTQRSKLNFVGAGVTATDDGANDATVVTVPGGSPGGSDTHVQFNDGGSLGGDAGMTYNKTTDTLTIKNVSLAAGGGMDFIGLKAISMVCDNGASLPGLPVAGQWFLHTPTGRSVLMMYSGSAWIPIISIGAMTVYVDGASGADSGNNGGSSGAGAFATIQYAVNAIPGLVGGNVIIYVAAGTYAESVVVQGKSYTGAYSIRIIGTLSAQTNITATGGTQGSYTAGDSTGTVTKAAAGSTNDEQHRLIEWLTGSGAGDMRVVDSNTATSVKICGMFSAAPASGDTFRTYTWGTVLQDVTVTGDQKKIYLEQLERPSATAWTFYGEVIAVNCKFNDRINIESPANYTEKYCVHLVPNGASGITMVSSIANIYGSKFAGSTASNTRAVFAMFSQLFFWEGTVITTFFQGFWVASGTFAAFSNPSANQPRTVVKSCTTGERITSHGILVNITSNVYHTGNTTNTSTDAASYGYSV